jgi:hypothetical protein
MMEQRKKRVYNFVFNSAVSSSFSGTKSDAAYRVDFKTIIPPESMNSSYLMTFRFKSLLHSAAAFNPTTHMMLLQASFSSQIRNSLNLRQTNIIGALNYSADFYPAPTTATFSLNTAPLDNPPVYVESLQDVNTIQLTLLDAAAYAKFTGIMNYICILSFEEL